MLSEHNQNLLDKFIGYLELQKSSLRTIEGYRPEIRIFLKHFNNLPAEEITKAHCLDYLAHLGKRRALRGKQLLMPNTIKRIAHALSSFYNYLVFVDRVTKNPWFKLPLPDGPGKPKVIMTVEECIAMIELPGDTRRHRMDKLFLEIFYSTGGRRNDLCTALLSDLNLEDATLKVIGKGQKPATLGLGASCVRALKAYLETDRPKSEDPHLLLDEDGTQYTGNQIYDSVGRSAKRAGITKRVHPHAWRRSMATHLRDRGCPIDDIQEILRHEDPGTTQIYIGKNPERTKKSQQQFHPRFA